MTVYRSATSSYYVCNVDGVLTIGSSNRVGYWVKHGLPDGAMLGGDYNRLFNPRFRSFIVTCRKGTCQVNPRATHINDHTTAIQYDTFTGQCVLSSCYRCGGWDTVQSECQMVNIESDTLTFEITVNISEFILLSRTVSPTKYCVVCRVIRTLGRSVCADCTKYLQWLVRTYHAIMHLTIEDVSKCIYSMYVRVRIGS